MNNKKESAVSPVIAVVLILALVVVIATMVSFSVISNVDNILINNVKDVDVTIKISGNNMSVYMVAGKDLALLEDYTLYRLGDKEFKPLVQSINATGNLYASVYEDSINDNISYINILGDFVDGEKAVIFTGKIVDGYVVQTNVVEDDRLFWVKYDDNGGSGDVPEDNHEYKPGSEVTVKFTPVPTNVDGNKFDGWKDSSGTLYTVTGTNKFHIYENTTLHANYTQALKYNVSYYTGGDVLYYKHQYNSGETVYVISDPTPIQIDNLKFKFDCWEDKVTGNTYVNGTVNESFIITSDVRLDAKWTLIPVPKQCHVYYNMNNAALTAPTDPRTYYPNDPSNNTVTVLEFPYDLNKNYTVNGKQQYFVSWNTQADGSGNSYYNPDTFVISYDMTLYAIWSEIDPYFRHGTTPDSTSILNYWSESNPNRGSTSYDTLKKLIEGINYWKKDTIEIISVNNLDNNDLTVRIDKDIPLAVEPITLKPDWKLTIIVNDTLNTTKIGNVYPSTNPAIWAAPIHNEIESLIKLNSIYGSSWGHGADLTLNTDLILDGNFKMNESIMMVSPNSNLYVGDYNLTIVNGIRVNKAITIDGGGIYNAGRITTDNGEIRIDNCWALNGGGFYNSNVFFTGDIGGDGKKVTKESGSTSVNAKFNITNCRADRIDEDVPKGAGGGIYSHSALTLKGGSVIDSCYAAENGGGIYVFENVEIKIMDGSKIINNKAESSATGYGNGGGIYSYYGIIKITNSNISGNTASKYGGGVYLHYQEGQRDRIIVGSIYLIYNGASTLANSIYGNNAAISGGGIYSNNTDRDGNGRVYYNNVKVSALPIGSNEYKWFSNHRVVNNAHESPNYYPGREAVRSYYTEGTTQTSRDTLNRTVNEWAHDYYGNTEDILKLGVDGNTIEVISDEKIVIADYPITILYDLNITGDKTLNLVSAPDYKGALLSITNTGTELITSANVTVDGFAANKREIALVNIDNGAILNVDKNEFIVKNGDREVSVNGNSGDSATASVYGGGINNAGTITVDDDGKLNVSNNKIYASAKGGDGGWGGDGGDATANAYGGGIYNTGIITVNNDGILDVNNNEAVASATGGNGVGYNSKGGDAKAYAYGGGIYNTGTITVNNDGNLNLSNNEANASATRGVGGWPNGANGAIVKNGYGGGIYNTKAGASDNYYKINVTAIGNRANSGGGIYHRGGFVEINGEISGNTAIGTGDNDGGGGIYSNSGDNSKIVKINANVSKNIAENRGGGIYAGYGSEVSGIVSDNTADFGGGIFNSGIINLNYPDSAALINSIKGNTAYSNGGGIYTNNIINAYYNNNPISSLVDRDVKRWFQNINPIVPYNSANTGDNCYPLLDDTPGYFTSSGDYSYTDSAGLINKINLWAIDYFGEPIFDESNNKVISSKPIIVASNPITIKTDLNIGGTDTLNIVSAPNYKGALLSIYSGKLTTSANVEVNGNNYKGNPITGREIALIKIEKGAELNVIGGIFTVQNGNNIYSGGGINDAGKITVNNLCTLIVSNNKAQNGGGIYIAGDDVNYGIITNSGTINVLSNTATTNGGGIFIDGTARPAGNGEIRNSGTINVLSNTATTNGGGIYINTRGKIKNNGHQNLPIKPSDTNSDIIIMSNEAESGGGIYIYKGTITNTFSDGKYPLMYVVDNIMTKYRKSGSGIHNNGIINSWQENNNYGIYGTNNRFEGSIYRQYNSYNEYAENGIEFK